MATKFRINGSAVSCPDPMEAQWDEMVELALSLNGRGVQQGGYKVTLVWELMGDEQHSALMAVWETARLAGYRITSAVVPPFAGADNATWTTIGGGIGGYIVMRRPPARRIVLHAERVELILENVARPTSG
jgi:hypothetical protein